MGHQVPLQPPGATGQPGRPPQRLPAPPRAAPGPSPWAIIALLAIAIVWLLGAAAEAQEQRSPGDLLAEAIDRGKLPPWTSAGARAEWKMDGLTVVTCLESRDRSQRWVTHGPWWKYLQWATWGTFTFGPDETVEPKHWALCGWPYPGVDGPTALGEPAYWSVICAGACSTGNVAWADMNNAGNLAGATVRGELCGQQVPGEPAGWHQLPRIQKNGSAAVTRCEP